METEKAIKYNFGNLEKLSINLLTRSSKRSVLSHHANDLAKNENNGKTWSPPIKL